MTIKKSVIKIMIEKSSFEIVLSAYVLSPYPTAKSTALVLHKATNIKVASSLSYLSLQRLVIFSLLASIVHVLLPRHCLIKYPKYPSDSFFFEQVFFSKPFSLCFVLVHIYRFLSVGKVHVCIASIFKKNFSLISGGVYCFLARC